MISKSLFAATLALGLVASVSSRVDAAVVTFSQAADESEPGTCPAQLFSFGSLGISVITFTGGTFTINGSPATNAGLLLAAGLQSDGSGGYTLGPVGSHRYTFGTAAGFGVGPLEQGRVDHLTLTPDGNGGFVGEACLTELVHAERFPEGQPFPVFTIGEELHMSFTLTHGFQGEFATCYSISGTLASGPCDHDTPPVPEPATVSLLALGAALTGFRRLRRS